MVELAMQVQTVDHTAVALKATRVINVKFQNLALTAIVITAVNARWWEVCLYVTVSTPITRVLVARRRKLVLPAIVKMEEYVLLAGVGTYATVWEQGFRDQLVLIQSLALLDTVMVEFVQFSQVEDTFVIAGKQVLVGQLVMAM